MKPVWVAISVIGQPAVPAARRCSVRDAAPQDLVAHRHEEQRQEEQRERRAP